MQFFFLLVQKMNDFFLSYFLNALFKSLHFSGIDRFFFFFFCDKELKSRERWSRAKKGIYIPYCANAHFPQAFFSILNKPFKGVWETKPQRHMPVLAYGDAKNRILKNPRLSLRSPLLPPHPLSSFSFARGMNSRGWTGASGALGEFIVAWLWTFRALWRLASKSLTIVSFFDFSNYLRCEYIYIYTILYQIKDLGSYLSWKSYKATEFLWEFIEGEENLRKCILCDDMWSRRL